MPGRTLHCRLPFILIAVLSACAFTPAYAGSAEAHVVDEVAQSGFTVPPANDNFAAAHELVGSGFIPFGSNFEATKEPGEPAHAGNPGGASVWYTWVAPQDGWIQFKVWSSEFRPLVAVYTGSGIDSLAEVASSDGFVDEIAITSVWLLAAAGTPYRIAVDGYGGETGAFEFGRVLFSLPPHDDFADALEVDGLNGTGTGTTVGATPEAGEPGGHYRASVWYRWTAPATRHVRFSVRGGESHFPPAVTVYTGTAVSALTVVADGRDLAFNLVGTSFRAQAGATYSIAVSSSLGLWDAFTLTWYPGTILFGTGAGETIRGTPGRDLIDARGGNDIVYAFGGKDRIIGGTGRDRLYGGYGNDRLNSRDMRRGNDAIHGGRGSDSASADRGDLIRGVP